MTTPDPAWVEAGAKALTAGKSYGGWVRDEDAWKAGTLIAEKVIVAVEPLIRADERERIVAELEGPARESEAMYAHAEQVAAKLVEVICERDERVGYWHRRWDFAHGQMDAMGASLLAARAEAAKYSAEIDRMVGELSAIRAEHEAEVAALRSVIAEGIEAFRLTKEYVNIPDENGFVLLPDVEGWSHWDWTVKAIALIEENHG